MTDMEQDTVFTSEQIGDIKDLNLLIDIALEMKDIIIINEIL